MQHITLTPIAHKATGIQSASCARGWTAARATRSDVEVASALHEAGEPDWVIALLAP